MTAENEYRLGRRAFHQSQEESVAVAISSGGRKRTAKVVYGAVNSTPVRCAEAEQALSDGVTPASVRKAAEVAAEKVECVDDVLATAPYRRHLVRVITTKVLQRMMKA